MPFPMRIQPIDSQLYSESSFRNDVVKPLVLKSRLKRLFDRQFNSVLRISATEKPSTGGEKDGGVPAAAAVPEFERSSFYLDKMVQNFIEDNEKQSGPAGAKYGRNRCNCFNGNSNDSSDDEFDFFDSYAPGSSFNDPSDTLKSLIPCASVEERNLLADTSKIVVENNKFCKRKDDLRKIVAKGLIALRYNASICKSKWEKSSSTPAGEYEYIDVIIECERLLIDVDFRSEFEIARSTSSYKGILQCLPYVFVGKSNRLLQIVSIISEAARYSLKKKGMHVSPWRKAEYMTSKWLGPHTRSAPIAIEEPTEANSESNQIPSLTEGGEFDLIFGEGMTLSETNDPIEALPESTWQLPAVKVKRANKERVTGLAALLKEKL